jgi:hypothetical protein
MQFLGQAVSAARVGHVDGQVSGLDWSSLTFWATRGPPWLQGCATSAWVFLAGRVSSPSLIS